MSVNVQETHICELIYAVYETMSRTVLVKQAPEPIGSIGGHNGNLFNGASTITPLKIPFFLYKLILCGVFFLKSAWCHLFDKNISVFLFSGILKSK